MGEANTPLPIKWMAPESIKEAIFSKKSDVVSMTFSQTKKAEKLRKYHNWIINKLHINTLKVTKWGTFSQWANLLFQFILH